MILSSIVSHWGQLRKSCATITVGSNTHWSSRWKTRCIKSLGENFLNLKISVHLTYYVFWVNSLPSMWQANFHFKKWVYPLLDRTLMWKCGYLYPLILTDRCILPYLSINAYYAHKTGFVKKLGLKHLF